MDIEPIAAAPGQAFRRAALRQRWQDATFLHWAVPPEVVAPSTTSWSPPPGSRHRPDHR
ncbi:DUF2071 domain-containing protein [Micromonospora pallida]|uniref:DUF2071 domain-containing protein n=1 Tax=Micromonospora pallida TaxID=145854 RepID=UPI00159F33B8|nr:DUF2071 domain-containing protein [Micromonospora pallida]